MIQKVYITEFLKKEQKFMKAFYSLVRLNALGRWMNLEIKFLIFIK